MSSSLLHEPFSSSYLPVHCLASSTIIPVLISMTLLPFLLDPACFFHFSLCPLGLFALNGHPAMTSASLRPPPVDRFLSGPQQTSSTAVLPTALPPFALLSAQILVVPDLFL